MGRKLKNKLDFDCLEGQGSANHHQWTDRKET